MIEFLLIFALGFLAAAILAMLITPTIYGRVVKLTEKRIEATVPLSLAEIKGKADQMRAGFASESAKLSTQLRAAQDELALNNVRSDKLQSDLAALAGDKQLADQRIEDLLHDAGEMRSDARKKEQLIDTLTGTVREFERIKKMDNSEIARLHNDLITISTEVESMRIDLAASHTETVNLRSQIDQVSIERDQLLNDIQAIADAAQTLEQKLQQEQESHNQARIDLAAVQTSLSDREAQLQETFELLELQKQQLDAEIRTLEGQLTVAADSANEQEKVLQHEQQEHEATRIELAASQSVVADRDSQLVQADDAMKEQARDFGKQIDALNKEQSRLAADLAGANERSESLQKDHEATRIELAASQSEVADRDTQLVRADDAMKEQARDFGKQIDALNKEQSRLAADLAGANEKSDSLHSDLHAEKDDHKETRIELSTAQSLLKDRTRQVAEANEHIEQQVQQLREASEANRISVQELRKAQRHIDALEGRVENTKTALEKSKTLERQAREKISELKSDARDLQKEFKSVTALSGDLERQLDHEQQQSARIASALKDKELELASRGKELEEALGDVSRRQSQLELVVSERKEQDSARDDVEKRNRELVDQINLLKTELKESHATSRQFKEQLEKMRKEIKRLHKGTEAGGNGAAVPVEGSHPKNGEGLELNGTVNGRVESLRQRHSQLIDKIKEASDPSADSGVREEIAAIAAAVVGLSGQREGDASPIHRIISDATARKPSGRVSLASRAKSELES